MRKLDFSGKLARQDDQRDEQERRSPPQRRLRVPRWQTFALWGGGVLTAFVLAHPFYRVEPEQIWLAAGAINETAPTKVTVNGGISPDLAAQNLKSVVLRINGIERVVTLDGAKFTADVSLTTGRNTIQAFAKTFASYPITVETTLPHYDIWMELTWQGRGDIDLHLVSPDGEECFFNSPTPRFGAVLDTDNKYQDGPEHITMAHAAPGTYQVKLNYYDSRGRQGPIPVDCHVVVKLRDGRIVRTFNPTLTQVKETQLITTFTF